MEFHEGNKCLSLKVVAYEFPDSPRSDKGDDSYDANWLMAEIRYTEDGESSVQQDACLLTGELRDLWEQIDRLKTCGTASYISDYMEPYLQVALLKAEGQILCAIQFVYDTAGAEWKRWRICSRLTQEELEAFCDELETMVREFPER